jgi:hypothetical protein
MGKELHKEYTDAQIRIQEAAAARESGMVKHVLADPKLQVLELLMLKCPHCDAAWFDHDACGALTCELCRGYFCSCCMYPARNSMDAHLHVSQAHKQLFVSRSQERAIHTRVRVDRIQRYFETLNEEVQREVFQSCEQACRPASLRSLDAQYVHAWVNSRIGIQGITASFLAG